MNCVGARIIAYDTEKKEKLRQVASFHNEEFDFFEVLDSKNCHQCIEQTPESSLFVHKCPIAKEAGKNIWVLILSMYHNTRLVGALEYYLDKDPRIFLNEEEFQFLTDAARMIALALTHHELMEKIQEMNKTLEQKVQERTVKLFTLYNLSQQLSFTFHFQELFERLTEHILKVTTPDIITLCIRTKRKGLLFIHSERALSRKVEARILRMCAHKVRSESGEDFLFDVTYHNTPDTTRKEIDDLTSHLSFPLYDSKGKHLGLLFLGNEKESEVPSEHIQFIQAIAYQISFAIERIIMLEQAQQEHIQKIIDALPDGLIVLDQTYRVDLTNPAGREILDQFGVFNKRGVLLRLGEHSIPDVVSNSLSKSIQIEIRNEHTLCFDVRSIQLSHSGYTILVLRDFTKEKEIQEKVETHARLAALGQLTAGIAHDFNNYLTPITGFAQLLKSRNDVPDSIKPFLQIIDEQAHQASQLIRKLLHFSRSEHIEMEVLDFLPFIKEGIKILQELLPENIQLHQDFQEDTCRIKADPAGLQEILMNLVINARDAMPNGGVITIRLRKTSLSGDQKVDPEMPDGDWVVLEIADTGQGIPSEHLPRIFEPFFTTKERGKGTGLGLSQVYGIVKQHNGFIDVKSQVGKGTTFTIYFPSFEEEQHARIETLTTPSRRLKTQQGILVIEDTESVRQTARILLQQLGFRVFLARTGMECIRILQIHRDEISCVLTDWVMPGLSQYELIQKLRRLKPDLKIFVMSGYSGDDITKLTHVDFIQGFIRKPFRLQDLERILDVLSQKDTSEDLQTHTLS